MTTLSADALAVADTILCAERKMLNECTSIRSIWRRTWSRIRRMKDWMDDEYCGYVKLHPETALAVALLCRDPERSTYACKAALILSSRRLWLQTISNPSVSLYKGGIA